jgi:hypothetical protein
MQGEYFALRLTPLPVWRERSNVGGDGLAGLQGLVALVQLYFVLYHFSSI